MGNLNSTIMLGNYGAAPNPSENIFLGNITETDYINLANNITSFMYSNARAPNYQTISWGNMSFYSLVYTYAEILNYYGTHNNTLPPNVMEYPWWDVNSSSTVFYNLSQIENASAGLQSNIETNNSLPSNVSIAGTSVTDAQFLQLETNAIQYIDGTLCTPFLTGWYSGPGNTTGRENITVSGNITRSEYETIATNITNFMNDRNNVYAPPSWSTSLGTMRYESLIYMYAKILSSYNATNQTLPQYFIFNPME